MKVLVQNYHFSDLWRMRFSILNTLLRPRKIINFLKIEFSKLLKLEKAYGIVPHFMIGITRDCNYKCTNCMRQLNPLEEQKLEEQKFKNLDMPIDQFKKK